MESQNRKLRVCHLGKYYPPAPGGIETHVQTLARAQAALGADVQVACVNHLNARGRDVTWSRYGATPTVVEDDGGVKVTRLGRSAHFAKLDVVPGMRNFFRSLKDNPVDIVHLHTPNPTMLLAIAALRPWAPVVVTHHSDVVKQRKLYLAFAPFERLVYDRAVRLISNSAAYVGGSDRLKQYPDKVDVLPMGLDLQPFLSPSAAAAKIAADLRAKYGSKLWVAVGRMVYYKGYDVALRALRETPGHLIVIGQGPDKEHLLQRARELGVADRVLWWGYASQDQVVGALHAANALWLPSVARSEAFGLVQVEAMASGCPVINTSIPASGVSWVSKHDITGLTVPPNDAHAFASAARRLLDEPELRSRLASMARCRAIERFAGVTMAARSLGLYTRILERNIAMDKAADPRNPQLQLGEWRQDQPTQVGLSEFEEASRSNSRRSSEAALAV